MPSTPNPTRAAALDRRLAAAPTLEGRLTLIRAQLTGRIAFSTSLGIEDQAVLHGIATAGVDVDLFTLDTGRLFPETLETVAASERRYGRRIAMLAPDAAAIESLVAANGPFGFRASVAARQACCAVRKVAPLKRGLAGAAGWLTGLRRGQSAGRGDVAMAAWDPEFELMKLNPLADWTLARLEDYVTAHDIPVNPLHARGFPSIGCQPCTRAVGPGENIRAGRWWWEREADADGAHWGKECGLHAARAPERRP